MSVTFTEVEQLVQQLYIPGQPDATVQHLQQQLQQLQKSDQGWQLADALLASQDASVRFFGALTFTVKLNGPWDQSIAPEILNRLKHWFCQLINDVAVVLKKLASTLVTFFVRSTWQHPHADLIALFPSLEPQHTRGLLYFSTALAEEMAKMEHSASPLHALMEEEVIPACRLMHSDTDDALHCFHMWANYSQPLWSTKPALQQLQSLTLHMLNEGSLDIFTDLLESYTSFFTPAQLNACAEIIPTLELDTASAQFIVAYGIAVIEDIIQAGPQAQVVLQPLAKILQEPGIPGDDDELTPITIEFWNTYVEQLISISPDEYGPQCKETLTHLTPLLWRKLFLASNSEEFRTFRLDTADLLQSMYVVLGKDMLKQFSLTGDWQSVEATLFCLKALADNIVEYEENDAYVLPFFQFYNTDNLQLRRTTIDMIGEYGALLKRHPESIPDAVRYLFGSLDVLPVVAAKSIYELCSTCRSRLTNDLSAFIEQYQTITEPYVKEKVAGGITAIIQALPNEQRVEPLLQLLNTDPSLECLLNMGKASQEPEDLDAEPDTFWQGPGKVVQDKILSLLTGDLDLICQILKTGYTEASGPFVFPAEVTINLLTQCSLDTPSVDSILSATATLITTTRSIDASRILDHITLFIEQLGHPRQDPATAQYCIEIAGKLFRKYAAVVTAHPKLPIILRFSLDAIESYDLLPKRAALNMWTSFVKSGDIGEYGPLVTATLIRQIAGQGQRSDLDYINEPLREMMMHAPHVKQWIEGALFGSTFPQVRGNVGDAQKRQFLAKLFAVRGGPKTKDITREFYALCRGTITSYP